MVCFFSFVFYSSLWLVVEKGEGGRGKDGRTDGRADVLAGDMQTGQLGV